jgi:hypothetical protein
MRATVLLLGAAVTTLVVAAGTSSPSSPPAPALLAAEPAGTPLVTPDVEGDGFDGRLYPDPETGCIRPWREGDGEPIGPEDVRVPRATPLDPSAPDPSAQDPSLQVQDPGPLPEPYDAETHRGPWPICDEPPSKVRDAGSR